MRVEPPLTWVLALALSAVGCTSPVPDPAPAAPQYGLVAAPPAAVGASSAATARDDATESDPEPGSDSDEEGDRANPPPPNVAPNEGVPL
jgi:hypothetical protein